MASCNGSVASEKYADFIIRHTNLTLERLYETVGTDCVDVVNREYVVTYVPLQDVLPISIEKYSYASIPKLYALLDTTSMDASGITAGLAQPSLGLGGQNTMIGLIDTGIDYQNPLFRTSDGATRILGIWDQTLPRPADSVPETPEPIPADILTTGFRYGREFTSSEINAALESENPLELVPSVDTLGHGTFLAGIAAGSELPDASFFGAAPLCNLGIVKLKPAKQYLRDFFCLSEEAVAYQENDIMMGIKYLLILAARNSLPLVILIGLGTNQGNHDGSSPLGQQLQGISFNLGVAAVIAAGNEAGYRHHYLGSIPQNEEFQDVEIRVPQNENGFTVELWSRDPELYTIGFVSPTGEQIARIPIVLGNETRITFLLESTVITVNYNITEIGSGSQLIFMRFEDPTAGIWRIRVFNSLFITGQFHMWLPVHGFISEETVFLRADPDTTITDPGNTPSSITVSTYNHENNSIYIHSSRGFSRSGRIKPEIAAPGVDVYGPGLPPATAYGKAFPMTRKTGSSIAAAHTAGAVANLLSWGSDNGFASVLGEASLKSYLIRGAQRDPVYTYPNGACEFVQLMSILGSDSCALNPISAHASSPRCH